MYFDYDEADYTSPANTGVTWTMQNERTALKFKLTLNALYYTG